MIGDHIRREKLTTEVIYVVRFLLIGVLNTVVGLGTIYACKYALSLGDIASNAIGYSVGLVNSFVWNRNWTFSHTGSIVRSILLFLLTFVLAYAANLATVMALISSGSVNAYLAHAIATAPYTIIFYLGSRYLVFSQRA